MIFSLFTWPFKDLEYSFHAFFDHFASLFDLEKMAVEETLCVIRVSSTLTLLKESLSLRSRGVGFTVGL